MISVPMFEVIDIEENTSELFDYNAVIAAVGNMGYDAQVMLDVIAEYGEVYLPDGFWITYTGDAQLPSYTFLMF